MKMIRKKIKLGDLLVAAGAITEDELMEALSRQKELGLKLGQTLVKLDYISQDILNATLQQQLGIDFISLQGVKLEEQILNIIPENLIRKYRAIPIEFDETNPNVLRVAMSDPMDIIALDDMSIATNYQIEPLLRNNFHYLFRLKDVRTAKKTLKLLYLYKVFSLS